MKFMHLSDLHLGKRIYEFSMIEDQRYIISQITDIAKKENPDAVIIAGDIYDRPVPPAEAVRLFDGFLSSLAQLGFHVFIINGNHDSPERISFGSRLMDASGIHIAPVYSGEIPVTVLSDKYGSVGIHMLPFIKPAHVRACFPDKEILSYTDAVEAALTRADTSVADRNILITHQFVCGALTCDSEEISVGGSDGINVSVFGKFDYVALGHLHGPQSVSRNTVRYCGTPLKYSFSEAAHKKSVTLVTLSDKGNTEIKEITLAPLRDMRNLKGSFSRLTDREFYGAEETDDYLHITLTDEDDIPDAIHKLRLIYPNIMQLDYDNTRTRKNARIDGAVYSETKSLLQLFSELYELQNNTAMSDPQSKYITELTDRITEEEI